MDTLDQLKSRKDAKGGAEIQVTKGYTAQYPDPICFDAGASISVGKQDPDYPGWFWCHTLSGKEGWVHRSFLAECFGVTKSVCAYNAIELTVNIGERGTLISELDGWSYIRLEGGDEGWIPKSHFACAL